MTPITLPDSGYVVEINGSPNTGQIEDLDDFVENHTLSTADDKGKTTSTYTDSVGKLKRELNYLIVFTFTKSIKDKEGKDLPMNAATVRELSFKDGEVWKKAAFKAQADLKKN